MDLRQSEILCKKALNQQAISSFHLCFTFYFNLIGTISFMILKTQHSDFQIKKTIWCELQRYDFFDDEERNIEDVSQLGVTSILVRDGLTPKVVKEGFAEYARQHPL